MPSTGFISGKKTPLIFIVVLMILYVSNTFIGNIINKNFIDYYINYGIMCTKLRSSDPEDRISAIDSISHLEDQRLISVTPLVMQLLDSPEREVRLKAIQCMGIVSSALFKHLETASGEEINEHWEYQLLRNIIENGIPHLISAFIHGSTTEKSTAITSLGLMRTNVVFLLAETYLTKESPDQRILQSFAVALGLLEKREALTPIAEIFKVGNELTKTFTIWALGKASHAVTPKPGLPPDEDVQEVVDFLIENVEGFSEQQKCVSVETFMLIGDPKTYQVLYDLITDPENGFECHRVTYKHLDKELLSLSDSGPFREKIIEAYQKIASVEAIPFLERLENHKAMDEALRKKIRQVMMKILEIPD
jgi:HEAT repeat protein